MAAGYGGLFASQTVTNRAFSSIGTGVTLLPRGAVLVVSVVGSSNISSMSISDDDFGTWVTAIPYESTNFVSQTWFRTKISTGASFTVTINVTSSSNYDLNNMMTYYTGTNGTISTYTTNGTAGATASVTSPATTSAGDLVIGVGYATGSAGYTTAGSGFYLGIYDAQNGNSKAVAHESVVAVNAGATYNTNFSDYISSYNKIGAFVIQNTPATPFAGWGIPLI